MLLTMSFFNIVCLMYLYYQYLKVVKERDTKQFILVQTLNDSAKFKRKASDLQKERDQLVMRMYEDQNYKPTKREL